VDPPGPLTYAADPATYVVGHVIDTNVVTNEGGEADSFVALDPLPAGLVLDSYTGALTGTPSMAVPLAHYTVEAVNAEGSAATELTITVADTGAVFNPLVVRGTRIDSTHLQLSISSYQDMSAVPNALTPWADTVGVWYNFHGSFSSPVAGDSMVVAIPLSVLQGTAEPYDTVVPFPAVAAGEMYCYLDISAYWHNPDSIPPFQPGAGDAVYMFGAEPASGLPLFMTVVTCSYSVPAAGSLSITIPDLDTCDATSGQLVTIPGSTALAPYSISGSSLTVSVKELIPLIRVMTSGPSFSKDIGEFLDILDTTDLPFTVQAVFEQVGTTDSLEGLWKFAAFGPPLVEYILREIDSTGAMDAMVADDQGRPVLLFDFSAPVLRGLLNRGVYAESALEQIVDSVSNPLVVQTAMGDDRTWVLDGTVSEDEVTVIVDGDGNMHFRHSTPADNPDHTYYLWPQQCPNPLAPPWFTSFLQANQ
jgi:hypothetical protein